MVLMGYRAVGVDMGREELVILSSSADACMQ